MHAMRTIAIDVPSVCQSDRHAASRGVVVQTRLNGPRSSLREEKENKRDGDAINIRLGVPILLTDSMRPSTDYFGH